MLEKANDWSDTFYDKWKPIAMGFVNGAEKCLQCGKCTGQCPAAAVNPSYNPRKIIYDLVNGNIKRVLSSVELWQCFFCSGCFATCPVDINFPFFVFMLRLGAMSQGFGWEDVKQLEKYAEKDYLQDGITVSPEERNPYVIEERGDIADIRQKAGMPRQREVSDEAIAEINMISDLSGMTNFMKKIGGVELYDCSKCTPKIEEKCKSKELPKKVGNVKTHYRFYNYGVPIGGADNA
ncbi:MULTISPECIES: 4Fe-4S dicluster domain-containing protein [unclassified Candidatus Frackibacter]|jgi:heterodisulfide reductase subunit C|uniref:4Fe-4S dicluster domain-containing protein n=1 Tax=unclassified Candidatus Frackibacter TaxID=2648818 RepID=UPI00088F4B3C|nr:MULTISPECIES: 4Fe-4S dicluster domain-containing protein [unclassified Candidatus Frackibacter]SDC20664.1 heterodisulfide reductase subunit C [Candidatus Frackibacter sp. WG11]SEM51058.1 heterodisulfide reductase subunit C [Candidatus Frackibacter sp. WG12]SFL52345.1 heterodisulfide reductase subunit C [Candidatus Frackibacter sp. WG13]